MSTLHILQWRIQLLKKEGAQEVRGLDFFSQLGDFLNNFAQKGLGVRPCALPSGSAPVLTLAEDNDHDTSAGKSSPVTVDLVILAGL